MCKAKKETQTKVDKLIVAMDRLSAALEKANKTPEDLLKETIHKQLELAFKSGAMDKAIASQYGLVRRMITPRKPEE